MFRTIHADKITAVAANVTCIIFALFASVSAARAVAIDSTQTVPTEINREDYEKLKSFKQSLDNNRGALEADIRMLNADCSRVSSNDSAKIQDCSRRKDQLLAGIEVYNRKLDEYNREITLVKLISTEQGTNYDPSFLKKYSKEEELQMAKGKLGELELNVKKIQSHLKVLTRSLLNNNSELETWQNTVDDAVNDTWEKGIDYLAGLPFEYGTYKLDDLLGKRLKEIELGSIRSADLLASTADPNKRNQYRAVRQWLAGEKKLAEYNKNIINGLEAVKTTYDLYAWDISKDEDYEKIIEGLSWLAGFISKPFSHYKMSVEAYTNVVAECYSWKKINHLNKQNDEYYDKVNEFSFRMNKNIKEITCLKDCMNDYREGCYNKCGGGSRLHTPPPLLD
ncbi:MAG: hypothetical protein C4538_07560 [Nitrospiraceae bacterium]|nr:MAG: hypothetical protein C4538_07560 [Nitrospiraceae bacterium]